MSDKYQEIELHQVRWLVISSYLVGIIFNVFSLRENLLIILPPLGLLLVLFWSVQLLRNTHLITAFLIGLLYDGLYQTLLGSHSLLFVLMTFFMLRMRLRFRSYRLWQQGVVIGFYMLFYQLMHHFFFSPALTEQTSLLYWLMPVFSAFIWPGLVLLMRGLSNRISTL